MPVTAAQYNAIKADVVKVTADQAALTTDTATQTTDQTAFAAALTGPAAFLATDGMSVDVVTPVAGPPPTYTVQTVPIVT